MSLWKFAPEAKKAREPILSITFSKPVISNKIASNKRFFVTVATTQLADATGP